MLVHEKNLSKLGQIADTTIESVELFTQDQIDNAIAAVKRLSKALTEAKKAFVKVVEELPEQEVDNSPEE